MSRTESKPFDISKQLVWEAYLKVAANKGAAGVDEQSISEFELDLKNNLYRLWNRMSSGSYFPPPVRSVQIPKRDGGVRVLGVPTVTDRIAQTVVAMVLEPEVEPIFHRRFVRVSAGAVRAGRGCRDPTPVLAVGLGNRHGYPGVLRHHRPWAC